MPPLDELEFLCHFCFKEGTLSSWYEKISFHSEQEDATQQEGVPQPQSEQMRLSDMLLIFNNIEDLWDDRMQHHLCCEDCATKILSSFFFYKTIQRATEHFKRLMQQKETKCSGLNQVMAEDIEPIELLEVDEIDSDQDDGEEEQGVVNFQIYEEECALSSDGTAAADLVDSTSFHHLDASISSSGLSDTAEKEAEQVEETQLPNCESIFPPLTSSTISYVALNVKNESVENLPDVLCPQLTPNISIEGLLEASDDTDIIQRKRRKISTPKFISKATMKNAFFVVPQFLPQPLPLPAGAADTSSRVCTIDYVAVCVKGSDLQQLTAECVDACGTLATDTVYKCQYCPQAFTASTFLITHQHKCHVCQFCTKAFSKTEELFEHMRTSHKRHECVICGAEYSSNSNLRGHIKRTHGVELPSYVPLLGYHPPGAAHSDIGRSVFVDEIEEYLSDETNIGVTISESV